MPRTKRNQLNEFLAERRPAQIGEAEWEELRRLLAPISEAYLRRLVRACDRPLDPVVEGVRQDSFEELERTLLGLQREYMRAVETGQKERAQLCRQAVIQGKEHARLAARCARATPERRAMKEEMAEWMLLWLENPSVFPTWLSLRKKAGPLPGTGVTRPVGE
ncbi:MAG: hypothetical protein ACUVXB_02625 [Bryobacteraceae bacterium]